MEWYTSFYLLNNIICGICYVLPIFFGVLHVCLLVLTHLLQNRCYDLHFYREGNWDLSRMNELLKSPCIRNGITGT